MANNKADEKRRETLTQCAGLMEEVTEKGINHMATFSLGQLKNISVITLAATYTGMSKIRRIKKIIGSWLK